MTIKEFVLTKDEFLKLASTRIHWVIRKSPVRCENGGGKILTTGEETLILSLTSITKENNIVTLEIGYGDAYPNHEEYQEKVRQIRADVKLAFPKATEGAWYDGDK